MYVDLIAREVDGNACERNGVDQGMHNFFVWGGRLEQAFREEAAQQGTPAAEIHMISNEEGWIATVQSMKTLQRDKAGRVMNELQKTVAVVHQWDRSNVLKAQYEREYLWLNDGERHGK